MAVLALTLLFAVVDVPGVVASSAPMLKRRNVPTTQAASPDVVTPHVLNVRKSDIRSSSSKHISMLQSRNANDRRDLPAGKATPLADVDGKDFVAEIQFNGQPYDVLVDTGSSETWLATEDFVCTNAKMTEIPREKCGMGHGFDGTFSGGQIPDTHFKVNYGTDWYCNGQAGYEDVTIAGITVPKQVVGLVDRMWWEGDGRVSGLMGLEGAGTGVYKGSAPGNDSQANQVKHDTLFTSMWKRNLTTPVFSMAQKRGSEDGWLAFGGLPPVNASSDFVSTPLTKSDLVNDGNGHSWYAFYNVVVEELIYGKPDEEKRSKALRQDHYTTNPLNQSMVLDSGTQLVFLQVDVAEPVFQSYDPPAQFLPGLGNFGVPCNATAPYFGIKIGGHIFEIDSADLIKQNKKDPNTGYCATGVGAISLPFSILGDTFLNNVIAVFDVGAGQMRFAEHKY